MEGCLQCEHPFEKQNKIDVCVRVYDTSAQRAQHSPQGWAKRNPTTPNQDKRKLRRLCRANSTVDLRENLAQTWFNLARNNYWRTAAVHGFGAALLCLTG
jgi:hypothetical protein